MYQVNDKIFDRQSDAQWEAHKADIEVQAKILELQHDKNKMILEVQKESRFRRHIGLTQLEQDADVIFGKIQQTVIELAVCYEMDKNDFVMGQASRKVANTRIMYNSVCKQIFKICLTHGVKSEHMQKGSKQ